MTDKDALLANIYQSAREVRSEDRPLFLQNACGSDSELRRQVEVLLEHDDLKESLLDQPAIRLAGELVSESDTGARLPGAQIGPYRLLSLVGRGGMGEVYRARDPRLDRTVALKLLHPHLLVDADVQRRFRSEARAVAGLSHRNIVSLFDIGDVDGSDFLVMEYVEGRTLKDLIGSGSLSPNDVIHYGIQIASALAAAHQAGIIHRDIKPANVMITPQSEVKVLDFGLAKPALPGDDAMTLRTEHATISGMIVGTVSYMSPEQTRGTALDARSDIFSLGCVLYEAATGRAPFRGPSTLAIMHEIAVAVPPPPSSINPKLPPAFDRIIQRALSKDKEDRYASAGEFADELRKLDVQPTVEAQSTHSSTSPRKWRRVAIVSLATLALLGAWTLRSWMRTPNVSMVAVLPFEDLSGNPLERYVTQGVTEDVIAQLGRAGASGFGVIAGNSVWGYRETHPTPRRVAADLGVGYVLTGTVRREGPTMRMTAQLTRTRDEVQVWADSFEEASGNLLSLQRQVASSVARAVATQLSRRAPDVAKQRPSIDADAYDLYLRGRFYWNQRTEVSLKQAIDYFQAAISRAPEYAPAYSGLADAYAALVYGCYLAPTEGFSKVRAALQKARDLDPEAAEVYASEGYMNMYFDWDFNAAARNLERAIALNPNYAPAYDWLGVLRTAMEDFPAAGKALERARVLDPASLPILTDVGFELHYSNRNGEAEKVLQQVFQRDPNFPLAHFWTGRVLHAMGNCDRALSELESAAPSLREWQPFIAAHGHVSGSCGDPAVATTDLHRLETLAQTRFVTSYGRALIYAGLNDREQAVVWLRKAIEERSHWMVWTRLDPRFNKVRAEPRFQDIVRQIFPKS